ncbi:ABC transporter related [Parafrankia sp. EAN1pec]|uniref:branched-chain amino acid ABC transporter ATP-binding protein/permease n=1 Tax=Parafrankia sp. (strain EAN1pec) TaxID=298653 RepID=UPI0000544CFC|nr:ABC transporter related [Frankia sp. EAN1pec]
MVLAKSLLPRVLAGPLLAVVLLVVVHGELIPAYQTYSLALAATYAVLVLSVGLLAGWAGVWSVGHPALFAIGAYTAAYGSAHGWGLEVTVLAAMALAGTCGAFLGFAGARFSVLYIALLTLAFSLVALEVINRWTGVTGGDQGVPVLELSSVLGLGSLGGGSAEAIDAAIVTAGVMLTVAALARPMGLRMRMVAAKSHPLAARSIGIAPEAQTALAFGASGAAAGLAGVLLALITGYVSPESFSLVFGINTIAAAVLGGVGTIAGAVVGGAFMAWSPTLADDIGVSQMVVQGTVLIIVLLLLPSGVVPAVARLGRAVFRRAVLPRAPWLRPRPGPASGFADGMADGTADRATGPAAPGLVPAARPEDAGGTASGGADAETVLEISDLAVTFGGLRALEGVSLSVRKGEVLAIIGPNGAGKTTLVNALSGLLPSGRVTGSARYRGHELLGRRATGRRGLGIGRTFQHAEPFGELSMLENLLCAHRWPTVRRRAEAWQLLEQVGLSDVADRSPHELPFGVRKRLDLARAIVAHPDLLILDEPFGGLDAGERALLATQVRRLRDEGVAIIIIDHVIEDLFAVADRVVAFDFGRPIGSGTPDVVLQDDAVRTSYLGAATVRPRAALAAGRGEPLVTLTAVGHRYGGVVALDGVDLRIPRGGILAAVGANGAGKSTLGKVVHGTVVPTRGTREVVQVDGRALRCSLMPEGRALFKSLSVRENLDVAAYAAGVRGALLRQRRDETMDWLPDRVRSRMSVSAGALSGGEQQLLATARALMAGPDLLVLDEPALGLAPAMVDEIYERIAGLAEQGLTVVLLEQLLSRALSLATDMVVLHEGTVAVTGSPADPGFAELAEHAYFGGAAAVASGTPLTEAVSR